MNLTAEDIVFDDEGLDLQEITGVNARIVHTPGHSNDSVSIILEDHAAIVGDVCVNMPPIFWARYIPPCADSLETVYASWQKLLDLGVARIFPGHGKPVNSAKLAAFLERRDRQQR